MTYRDAPSSPAAESTERKSAAAAIGFRYWPDAGAYQDETVRRLAAAIRANSGELVGLIEPEPMPDSIIRKSLNAFDRPYAVKVGDCWSYFADFDGAIAFAGELRGAQRIAA